MNYEVILTDTAKEDLREIALYLAKQTGDRSVAKRFVAELRDKCRELEVFPNSGALPRDRILKSMGYRFVVHKNYLLFYLVDDEKKTVSVMAIFNGKRDYLRVMSGFNSSEE